MQKKNFILSFMLLFSVSLLFGQKTDVKRTSKIDHLKMELELTDDQANEVESILKNQKEKIKALKEANQENKSNAKESFLQLKTETDESLKAVLNETQYQKYVELDQNRKKRSKMKKHVARKKMSKAHHGKMRKGAKELKDYHKENIHPVMLAQRQKLEEKISAEDKLEIAELREVMKTKKLKREKELKERKANKKANKDNMRAENKRKHRANDTNREEHKAKIDALLEKYGAEIEALHEEIKEQKGGWDSDMKQIKEKHKTELRKDRESYKQKGEHMRNAELHRSAKKEKMQKARKEQGAQKHKKGKRMYAKKHKAVHFLLMDPNQQPDVEALKLKSLIEDVNIYPNPANTQSTIEFNLLEEGPVSIEVRDDQGMLVSQVLEPKLSNGLNKVSLDLSRIQDGSYIVLIKDQRGMVLSQKLTIAK